MSKEVLEIATNGKLIHHGIHENGLEKLGKRTQKNILVQRFLTLQTDMLDSYEAVKKCKNKAKSLRRAIKLSEPGKKLSDINREGVEAFRNIATCETRMRQLIEDAEYLGIDIKSDLKKIKAIEIGD